MNKQTKQYYRNIKKKFPLMGDPEKKFLQDFLQYLETYERKHPDANYDDYINKFGEIDEIIASFYEHVESEYIIKRMKSAKIIKYVGITLLTIFLIIAIFLISLLYREYQTIVNEGGPYYFTEEIIEYN